MKMNIYRRSKTSELFVILFAVICLLYGYYSMQELRNKLDTKEKETDKTHHYAKLLREQLKVLYKHTGKLEQALKDEKTIHKTTKQELLEKVEEFQLNATKTKHEAVNRFNALDTDYKMLKANYEETYQNYAVLQQQHVRLNEAHKKMLANAKTDCDKIKLSIENETLHLHSRIQALYRENMDSHQMVQEYQQYQQDALKQIQVSDKLAHEFKEKMKYYEKEANEYKKKFQSCQRQQQKNGGNVTIAAVESGNETILQNNTTIVGEMGEEDEIESEVTTTEHTILGPAVGNAGKHWPTNQEKYVTSIAAILPPIGKPLDGEMLSEEDRTINGDDDQHSGGERNIELNELLDNKPIHISLSTKGSQIQLNEPMQPNVDNKNLREVTMESSEDELSQNLMNNSTPD